MIKKLKNVVLIMKIMITISETNFNIEEIKDARL